MTTLINAAEMKKKRQKKKNAFRWKFMIPDSEIRERREDEVKSKIGNMLGRIFS